MSTAQLTLLRHGLSVWNRERRFTGWTDVELTDQRRAEAARVGRLLVEHGFHFDICFCSELRRSRKTLRILLAEVERHEVPVEHSWRLNERHYGALQGLTRWQALRR